MNLGTLFNTLGAAIFDGVPEDAEIIICEDDSKGERKGDVKAVWLYTNPDTGKSEILLASYPFKQMPNLRLLWEKPHHPAAWTAPF